MRILVINSGSSSIKFCLFDNLAMVKQGIVERANATSRYAEIENILKANPQIDAVGHRVVHGGEQLYAPALITPQVLQQIQDAAKLAPLHSQPTIEAIQSVLQMLPDTPQVAVFDTAAFFNLEPKAYLYALPKDFYEKHHIRRFGFHGINHQYLAKQANDAGYTRIITCHLGSGCSISAFHKTTCIDTSMGFTPLEGLVMGTRSGDIDPSIILYMIKTLGLPVEDVEGILNKKSGLLGLCGKNDIRDVTQIALEGNIWARKALDLFVYRIQKYIGAYTAALNGLDALVFSAGIGENSPEIRSQIASAFSYLGIEIDSEKNHQNEKLFSTSRSKVALLTIPAQEELEIAEQTFKLISR